MSLSLSYVQFSRCVRSLPGFPFRASGLIPQNDIVKRKAVVCLVVSTASASFSVPASLRLSASQAFPFFRFRVRRPQVTLRFLSVLPRKEVIQPHLPIRLPCYDFTPVIGLTFGGCSLRWLTDFGCSRLPWCDGRCVQGPGTYSPRHADSRLLATPTSCGRVAAHNPNWDGFFEIRSALRLRPSLLPPL